MGEGKKKITIDSTRLSELSNRLNGRFIGAPRDNTAVKQQPVDIKSLLQPSIDKAREYFNANKKVWAAYTIGSKLPSREPEVKYSNKAGRNNAYYDAGTKDISFGDKEALNAFANKDKMDSTGSNVYAHEYSHLLDDKNSVNPEFIKELRKRYKEIPVEVGLIEHYFGGPNEDIRARNKYYKSATEMTARLNEIRVDANKNRDGRPYDYQYPYSDSLDIPKFSRVPNEYKGRLSGKDLIDLLNYWATKK